MESHLQADVYYNQSGDASSASSEHEWSAAGSLYPDGTSTAVSSAGSPATLNENMDLFSFVSTNALPTTQHSFQVTTMPEVRAAIDHLDQAIVTLLGTRMRFIEAASRIKPARSAVRDQWRVDDVITKAKKTAEVVNFPSELVGEVFAVLVEGSIRHEFRNFDKNHNITQLPEGEEKW